MPVPPSATSRRAACRFSGLNRRPGCGSVATISTGPGPLLFGAAVYLPRFRPPTPFSSFPKTRQERIPGKNYGATLRHYGVVSTTKCADIKMMGYIMRQNEFLCFQVITMTDENFFKGLGQRISQARKQANLTQVQLADMLGLKQQVVASYEVGRRRVPASSLPQLALALGVSVEDLLGRCNRSTKPGPAPKLQQQIEQLQRLPKGKQKFVSEFLETVLKSESRA